VRRDRLERLAAKIRPESWLSALAAIFALTLVGGWLYGLRPVWRRYGDLAASPVALGEIEARAAESERTAVALEAELVALRERLYGNAGELPPPQLEAHLIDRLDRLSARNGVQLLSVTPDAPDRVPYFDEFPYQIDASGRYFALYSWLASLEHELRPLIVKSFELAGGRADGSVQMRLRLVSYRLRSDGA
jgi:Tfp pilus assembly protein PilO